MPNFNQSYRRSACCWNCQAPGHTAIQCSQPKRIFCSFCLKKGTTSRDCQCQPKQYRINKPLPINSIEKYPECSRPLPLVAEPAWISVGDETFKAFINTSQTQTIVGSRVSVKASLYYQVQRKFIIGDKDILSEMLIPLRFKDTIRAIKCRISEQPDDVIFLGLDALRCFGYQFNLGVSTALKHPGCPPLYHQSVFDIALIKSIDNMPTPPRTPLYRKNPIDLHLYDAVDEEMKDTEVPSKSSAVPKKDTVYPSTSSAKPAMETTDIQIPSTSAANTTFPIRNLKWSEMELLEPQSNLDVKAQELAAIMTDAELEDYLRLDADITDMGKLD